MGGGLLPGLPQIQSGKKQRGYYYQGHAGDDQEIPIALRTRTMTDPAKDPRLLLRAGWAGTNSQRHNQESQQEE